MSKALAVFNVTRGYSFGVKQAQKAVENCACAWVEHGKSIRDLTLQESIAARAVQAENREPLPYAEVFGLRFDPPAGKTGPEWQSRLLAYEATLFAETVNGVPA